MDIEVVDDLVRLDAISPYLDLLVEPAAELEGAVARHGRGRRSDKARARTLGRRIGHETLGRQVGSFR